MAHRHIAALAITTTLAGGGFALAQDGGQTGPGGPDNIDPCEGGFYLADENRDGTISAEELENAALAAFARFDTDGSGDVTQAEYEACANAGAGVVGVPAQRVESNLPEYDTNDDGQLSQKEFMNAAGEAYQQARVEANLEDGQQDAGADRQQDADVADASDAMTGADAQTAGEGDEMTAGADQGESAEMAEEGDMAAAGAGQQAGSGQQDANEPVVVLRRFLFIPESRANMNAARMGREEATQRALQNFIALDEDRSGMLEPQEWAQSRAVRQDMSDLLSTRFNRDDVDQSGSLTADEFVAAEERRRQQAAEQLSQDSDGGANPPVVYYRYPHVM